MKPVKLRLSPWPNEEVWATPVEWSNKGVLVEAPLAAQQLDPLATDLTTYFTGPFSDLQSERVVGTIEIDGRQMVDLRDDASLTETQAGWRRAEAPWSFSTETFASVADLEAALVAIAADPQCARIDWVALTRNENVAASNGPAAPVAQSPADAGP